MIIFHPALAPYRLDLFNSLSKLFDVKIVFLLENLLNQKFDQTLLTKKLLTEYIYLEKGFVFKNRILRYGFQEIINEFRPDTVVTSEFSPSTLLVIISQLLKSVKFRHLVWTDDNPEYTLNDSLMRRIIRKYVLMKVDGLICLSKESATLYREVYGYKKAVAVCPILHDENCFQDNLQSSNNVLNSLIPTNNLSGKRLVIYVGRLAKEKRIDRVIEAFGRLVPFDENIRLAIVGDGPLKTELENMVEFYNLKDNVIFTGRVEGDNLYAWLRLGGLLVLASESEPYGAVVNEALLAGMYVVCSHKAGARCLVNNDINGDIVDASDPEMLKFAIGKWLSRLSPISAGNLHLNRPSKMTISFRDSVKQFALVV